MLRIFLQYIILLNKIRKSKQKGYEGIQISLIYPVNQEKLRKKGYSIYEPSLFSTHYTIRWGEAEDKDYQMHDEDTEEKEKMDEIERRNKYAKKRISI